MSYCFFPKGYAAPLMWTLLQRDTAVSPGMPLSSRAPILRDRDSCVSPCPGSKDRALSLLHAVCKAGALGSAFRLADGQASGPHVPSSRLRPGPGEEGLC